MAMSGNDLENGEIDPRPDKFKGWAEYGKEMKELQSGGDNY